MSDTIYESLVEEFVITKAATTGKWFGLPCAKINGKVFMALWIDGGLIAKPAPNIYDDLISRDDIGGWRPVETRAPMKGWALVPVSHSDEWQAIALSALEYVKELSEKKKK